MLGDLTPTQVIQHLLHQAEYRADAFSSAWEDSDNRFCRWILRGVFFCGGIRNWTWICNGVIWCSMVRIDHVRNLQQSYVVWNNFWIEWAKNVAKSGGWNFDPLRLKPSNLESHNRLSPAGHMVEFFDSRSLWTQWINENERYSVNVCSNWKSNPTTPGYLWSLFVKH